MITTGSNLAHVLACGDIPATFTSRYDGVSAVTVGPDGMVRSLLPIRPGDHAFALALEVGGRAMNLLFPYEGGHLCAHGVVQRALTAGSDQSSSCACGQAPIGPNPARDRALAAGG